jgi:hypothetical protein
VFLGSDIRELGRGGGRNLAMRSRVFARCSAFFICLTTRRLMTGEQ